VTPPPPLVADAGTDGVRRHLPGPRRAGDAPVRRAAPPVQLHDRTRAGDEGVRQRHRLRASVAVPSAVDQLVHRRLQDRGVGLQHRTGVSAQFRVVKFERVSFVIVLKFTNIQPDGNTVQKVQQNKLTIEMSDTDGVLRRLHLYMCVMITTLSVGGVA